MADSPDAVDRRGRRRRRSGSRDRPNMSMQVSREANLNLVLCGSDATLNGSISKIFMGEKNLSISHQTEFGSECVRRDVELHGRQISLVELPALNQLSEKELKRETLNCVSLFDPGVHVFLLIIPDAPLTDEDKAEIEKIQKIFDSNEHLMLLFTLELTDSPEFQNLISLCGGQYRVIGLNEPENSRQIPELLDYIENMKTEPYSLQMYVKAQENRASCELKETYEEKLKRMDSEIKDLKQKLQSIGVTHDDDDDDDDDLRIVLLGKTGVGKSATGNTILRREAFESKLTSRSVTRECQKEISEINRRQITVIDTPGLFDTAVDNVETRKEIVRCVSMAAPGPHVFLLVIQLGRFTQEEKDAVKMIQETFGDQSRMFTMVLFTRGDELKRASVEDFIEGDDSIQYLIQQCGKRYHVFNNNEIKDQTQVSDLLEKIDCLVKANGGSFYTNEMFQLVEKNIKEEQEKIKKEKEEEIKRKEEELKTKYEADIEQMKKENEREREEIQNELRRSEVEFKKKEEEIKKEKDENLQKEVQRKLEEQQKLFEEENKRKENALGEQQQNFIKYLEEKHEKEKQKLQKKIQHETREQAEGEFREKLKKEVDKAVKEAEPRIKEEAEAKVPYRSKRARDWGYYVPVAGAAVGGTVGTVEDIAYWIGGFF